MPLLVALLACTTGAPDSIALPWDTTEVPPALAVRPPPVLDLYAPAELTPGHIERFEVHGAAAEESVYLIVTAGGVGPGPCHAGLGGRCLDVRAPIKLFLSEHADDSGVARFDLAIPDALSPGLDVGVQGFIVRGWSGVDTVLSEPAAVTVGLRDTGAVDTGFPDCRYDTAVPPDGADPDPDPTWTLTRDFEIGASDAVLGYDHHHATVEVHDDGDILVAWDEGDPPFARVKASLIGADGSFVSSDFFVGYLAEYVPGRPDVAAVPDGGWLVAYGTATDVYVVAYDRAGVETARSEPVNEATGTAEFQGMPDLAMDGDGAGVTVMYMFGDEEGTPLGRYYIRRMDAATLTPISEERRIASSVLDPSPPDAAAVGDGVAVVWSERTADCDEGVLATIRAQRFDGAGVEVGEPFRVDQADLSEPPSRPVIAGTAAGWYAVAWRAQNDARNGVGARLRLFDPAGRPMADARELEAEDGADGNRPVVDIADNVLIVSWEEDFFLHGRDVFMQAFDVTTGLPITAPVRVNEERGYDQERPDIAIAEQDDGSFAVVVTYESHDEPPPSSVRTVKVARWVLAPL